ncbi:MAG: hypothetical protein HY301_05010 [Verrucomicrobia bacterium]|nr:hypothetical protein [Verrucomicrobiota bacterium]
MNNIESAELEFIEAAKKLAERYRAKLAQLEAFIADGGTNGSAPLGKPRRTVRATHVIRPVPLELVQIPMNRQAAPSNNVPQTIPQWIRFAIQQQDPTGFKAPQIKDAIAKTSPETDAQIVGTRISSELYRMAQAGELRILHKVPGGASVYGITDKFTPWIKYRRK